MLERTYWGEIDDHVHWLCENYSGHEFINGEAQISVCPTDEGILIMVFGCANNSQMLLIDGLFKLRGTIQDIFIEYKQYEFDNIKNECRINAGAFRGVVEAKTKDRNALI